MYKDIDEAIREHKACAREQRKRASEPYELYPNLCRKRAEEHEQYIAWLEELKELRELKDTYAKGMETSYSEFRYKQGRAEGYSKAENDYFAQSQKDREDTYNCGYAIGRADVINPIQKFIDDYDGAIIISENMGVINGRQLINELKEIVEQLKE